MRKVPSPIFLLEIRIEFEERLVLAADEFDMVITLMDE